MAVVLVAVQIAVQLLCSNGVVGVVGVGKGELPQRPEARLDRVRPGRVRRVKHSSILSRAAQRRMRAFLWADRLSRIT